MACEIYIRKRYEDGGIEVVELYKHSEGEPEHFMPYLARFFVSFARKIGEKDPEDLSITYPSNFAALLIAYDFDLKRRAYAQERISIAQLIPDITPRGIEKGATHAYIMELPKWNSQPVEIKGYEAENGLSEEERETLRKGGELDRQIIVRVML